MPIHICLGFEEDHRFIYNYLLPTNKNLFRCPIFKLLLDPPLYLR